MTNILITGAGGYIGRRLVLRIESLGHVARTAGKWRLGAEPLPEIFSGVDVVVHLAHSWRNEEISGGENINLAGSERLARAALSAGVRRFIFVSSVSADPSARNIYGRVKHATEERLLSLPQADQSVVCARVGLVYGGDASGQYGAMRRLVRAPVLPMIGLRQEVQPIHIDEVCAGLLALATGPVPLRPVYVLAAPRPLPFGRWLRLLRRAETGKNSILLIPLPFTLVLLASRILSALPFAPKLDRERILGLAGTRFRESAADLECLDVTVSDPAAQLVSSRFANRARLQEARVLLRYLLARPAPRKAVIRLARLLEKQGETALSLPALVRHQPAFLRLFDPLGGKTALARHLQIAAMVAEMLPGTPRLTPARAMLEFLLEGLALPIRLAAGRIIQ